ncbi:MAG: 50S ribosomal protein L20 [Candidatus Kerfeldbacteria bacterium CG15_BIG_FIL_POST_REV_8_21_14_020_45_12]|uniref:Large ribosomal subunit protein bL20 n=1 Tax=Candidatus Kerfeldbacteria bacterium CG15_BIG_FIL_POST_REV_8_21_14_020_45_12 TaxID=2014247 RepID=A0A2M7H303_9BACT|nr:MAG: 50S ribosomal protein L20 [Candidatus Kerfeldbacteria bacterium CG15_BIG_FIL_POST_REV_8_21_14_020_45_12]PJA93365.1 MAG: 50S ribosomal protein L20 [Candidatus Kerfeldbacteria bacterium CG_4_9_14_3_um_filter_45_8]
MARVKGGPKRTQRRKSLLKKTKGFSAGRKNLTRQAKTAAKKAGQRAFDHRKLKKRQFRALWQIKISAGAKLNGTSYSKLMGNLKKHNIELDRKILADMAEHHPELFSKIVEAASK